MSSSVCIEEELKKLRQPNSSKWLHAGAIFGAIPFVLTFRMSSTSSFSVTEGDVVVEEVVKTSSFDYVAVPCGAMAVMLALVSLGLALRIGNRRTAAYSAGVILLGLLQIARGLV